jgi:hypothetical protein
MDGPKKQYYAKFNAEPGLDLCTSYDTQAGELNQMLFIVLIKLQSELRTDSDPPRWPSALRVESENFPYRCVGAPTCGPHFAAADEQECRADERHLSVG